MSQNPAFDASIPVLTEVFSDKADKPAPAPASAAQPEVAQDPVSIHLERRAVDTWTEPEWNLLERRLSERIMHQLQGRVDFVLEQRVRDSMEEALNKALDGFTSELRVGLQETIEKIVARAVSQELAHLQALKK
jgi:hypothetical protein